MTASKNNHYSSLFAKRSAGERLHSTSEKKNIGVVGGGLGAWACVAFRGDFTCMMSCNESL